MDPPTRRRISQPQQALRLQPIDVKNVFTFFIFQTFLFKKTLAKFRAEALSK